MLQNVSFQTRWKNDDNKNFNKKQQELVAQEFNDDEQKDELSQVIDKIDGDSGKQFFKNMVKHKMGPEYGKKNW